MSNTIQTVSRLFAKTRPNGGTNRAALQSHKATATNAIKGFDFRDRQTGRVVTLHSLRGIFMMQAFNNMQKHRVSKEAIKKALDHLHGDKVDLSYSEKADFLDELKILLDWWSGYILEIKNN